MIYQNNINSQRLLPNFDHYLIWFAILWLSLGLVMVYSASISIAEEGRGTNGYSAYFLVRHGVDLAVGLLAGLIGFQLPIRLWQKYSLHLFFLGAVLLLLVLVPGIGLEDTGSGSGSSQL